MFAMHIIAHFSFQFFKIYRSSEEDKCHKEGEAGEGGQESRVERVQRVDEKR